MGDKVIQAQIYDWFGGLVNDGKLVEIQDLEKWIVEHDGAVQVRPPNVVKQPFWSIIITDETNRFYQR